MTKDKVFQTWKFSAMLSRVTKQIGARAVIPEFDDSTLDKIWGLTPNYLGIVIRRRPQLTREAA